MTNEEKAREIGHTYARQYRHNCGGDDFVFSSEECSDSALEMAEWKDKQFKEYLEKKKEEYELEKGTMRFGGAIINKIISELFKEN